MPGYLELAPRGASHSFRRHLDVAAERRDRSDDNDLRLFALAFTAFFVCFYTFLM